MKIMVCGSMQFAKEMLDAKKKLEDAGYSIIIARDCMHYLENPEKKQSFEEELEKARESDAITEMFDNVASSDSILVVNYPKNGIAGYIGTSVLMEMAVAYYLKKPIFLLNPIDNSGKCALELILMNPVILDGDLSKIHELLSRSL